jgi:hypothetical protein
LPNIQGLAGRIASTGRGWNINFRLEPAFKPSSKKWVLTHSFRVRPGRLLQANSAAYRVDRIGAVWRRPAVAWSITPPQPPATAWRWRTTP